MATETVENYLKAIYLLLAGEGEGGPGGSGGGEVRAAIGDIAAAVRVTPGTATTMVKRLAREKMVKHERYGGVQLTSKGERAALSVLRRHRLIETFLVRTLGMDWSEVHEEAEKLEHAVSEGLLARLDAFLGHPAVDPHGDPIPDASGRLREVALVAVARCRAGAPVRLARVLDQSADFLRFLERHALRIDARLTVESAEPGAGTITIRLEGSGGGGGGGPVTLSERAAGNLLVEPLARGR